MKIISLSLVLLFTGVHTIAQQSNAGNNVQIKLAVLAAPAELRDSATVYGFDANGKHTVLRKGTNSMICLADDPTQKGFSVSCYHRDMEPFMKRGRELKAMGKKPGEIQEIREHEVKAGKLKMNIQPSTLYALTAKAEDYDSIAGEVKNTYLRYVVYIPYATSASTGLPLKPDVPVCRG
jgi:hypothetical protein